MNRASSIGASVSVSLLLIAGLTACGDSAGSTDAGADSGVIPDAGDAGPGVDVDVPDTGPTGPRIETGFGQDEFNPVATGAVLDFELGNQTSGESMGGYHLTGAVRALEIDPMDVLVTMQLLDRGSRQPMATAGPFQVSLIPDGSGAYIGFGFRAILEDCCPTRNLDLVWRAEVQQRSGMTVIDERDVVGDTSCLDRSGIDICP